MEIITGMRGHKIALVDYVVIKEVQWIIENQIMQISMSVPWVRHTLTLMLLTIAAPLLSAASGLPIK